VSRKITRGLARIKEGLDDCLYLGNLDARRDWGHARDYTRAQWLILQQPKPDDYVIATGEQHSVREFVVRAGAHLQIRIDWRGSGLDEQGIDARSGKVIVKVDPRYFRPTEVDSLLGDASKARSVLGWRPEVGFDSLVEEMVEQDLALARRDALIKREGFKSFVNRE
jgi:GDPmannose 4,6-dehydratase